jgi:ABC-type glycerol-3-phosphate transport system substrate-binding protein
MLQNNVNLANPVGQSAEESLQYYTIFNRADHIWDSTLPQSTVMFANGKLAMYFAPSWRAFDLISINPKLKFTVSPIPQLPLDEARGEKPITWASYWAEGVNKNSTQSAASWKWIKYLSSKETMQKLHQVASNSRAFGEIYSRSDMSSLITNPMAMPFVTAAANARSWYLSSNTFDGATGINTKIGAAYGESIDGINQGKGASEVTKSLSTTVNGVLSQYGLATQFVAPIQ